MYITIALIHFYQALAISTTSGALKKSKVSKMLKSPFSVIKVICYRLFNCADPLYYT